MPFMFLFEFLNIERSSERENGLLVDLERTFAKTAAALSFDNVSRTAVFTRHNLVRLVTGKHPLVAAFDTLNLTVNKLNARI